MRITVIAVGKVKEKFYREAIAEYEKRLGRYCKLEIIQVEDEQTPDKAGAAQEDIIKKERGRPHFKVREGECGRFYFRDRR